jgi:SNF2 family DNA or RNA helicase
MHAAEVVRMKPDLVVCDEAHALKNAEAQITAAVAALPPTAPRLLLSGTPVQNDLSEFFSVFSLAVPGLLGDARDFARRFERPILRGRDADAEERDVQRGQEAMMQLGELCHRFMLRRTSAVLKKLLPPRVEQVVFCRPSRLQLALFQAFLEAPAVQALIRGGGEGRGGGGSGKRSGEEEDEDEDEDEEGGGNENARANGGSGAKKPSSKKKAPGRSRSSSPGAQPLPAAPQRQRLAPLVAIGMLKKLCCHPDLIYSCVAEDGSGGGRLDGGKSGAPVRRSGRAAAVGPASYAEPSGRGGNGNNANDDQPSLTGFEAALPLFSAPGVWPPYRPGTCQPQHSGKLLVLESLLRAVRQSEPTDKFVLVSNHTTNLDVMGRLCAARGWRTLRLDGSSSAKARQSTVDRFNGEGADSSLALLLSSKAGGTGLNIIGANRLVLFDSDWNPSNDLQAMARVWREGQKKTCYIYRLVTAGTIEEKILQRQLCKTGLADTLVDREEERRMFSRTELRSLFRVSPETATCETHAAVRCGCDGSAAAARLKRKRAERAAGGEGGSASKGKGKGKEKQEEDGGEGEKQGERSPAPPAPLDAAGVGAWAHYASARDCEADPAWRAAPQGVIDGYVSFLFSDHAINDAWWRHERAEQRKTEREARGGVRGSEDEAEAEEEAPAPKHKQHAAAARRKAHGGSGSGSGEDDGDDDDEDYNAGHDGACGADDDEW